MSRAWIYTHTNTEPFGGTAPVSTQSPSLSCHAETLPPEEPMSEELLKDKLLSSLVVCSWCDVLQASVQAKKPRQSRASKTMGLWPASTKYLAHARPAQQTVPVCRSTNCACTREPERPPPIIATWAVHSSQAANCTAHQEIRGVTVLDSPLPLRPAILLESASPSK